MAGQCSVTSQVDATFKKIDSVIRSGLPNYLHCKFPIQSKLNIQVWIQKLQSYQDTQIVQFLQFGWPIGFEGPLQQTITPPNHKGIVGFEDQIQAYLSKELDNKAVMGPFDSNPFDHPIHISPLNSVEKKDSEERRIILDLSFPKLASINTGIPDNQYLGETCDLTYPNIDNFISLINDIGPGALMYKRDLRRAYRQFPIDLADIPKLGYQWKGQLYFDRVLPMGLRSAAYICQRITNAVSYMAGQQGLKILNYLDDFAGVDYPLRASSSFKVLGSLLYTLGLEESQSKAEPPTE